MSYNTNKKMMKKLLFSLFATALFITQSFGQTGGKVANFSYSNNESPDFESYSFWVRGNHRSDIDYSYKSKTGQIKQLKLTHSGVANWKGQKAFKVKYPNGLQLYIIPAGEEALKIIHPDGSYSKIFKWLYEGPVNGIGTWCEPCTQNGKEAVKLVKTHYLK